MTLGSAGTQRLAQSGLPTAPMSRSWDSSWPLSLSEPIRSLTGCSIFSACIDHRRRGAFHFRRQSKASVSRRSCRSSSGMVACQTVPAAGWQGLCRTCRCFLRASFLWRMILKAIFRINFSRLFPETYSSNICKCSYIKCKRF